VKFESYPVRGYDGAFLRTTTYGLASRDAVEAVRALTELGVRPVMLSGDSQATAERIAAAMRLTRCLN
jgi:P-type Cu2+ transporter